MNRLSPSTCPADDDLALLAGGDLGDAALEQRLRAHLGACAACSGLAAAFEADRDVVASVVEADAGLAGGGVAERVLASLDPAPWARGTAVPAARRTSRLLAAAAAVAVGVVGLTVWTSRPGDTPAREEAGLAAVAEAPADLPVRVTRGPGGAVELAWMGDGRQAEGQRAYRVLASASPGDFAGAQAIEVAGEKLVATAALPSRQVSDRKVTYFRVQ